MKKIGAFQANLALWLEQGTRRCCCGTVTGKKWHRHLASLQRTGDSAVSGRTVPQPGQWWDNGFNKKDGKCSDFLQSTAALSKPVRGAKNEGLEAITRLCDDGQMEAALEELELMAGQGNFVSPRMLYLVLRGCIAHKNLAVGRRVHALALQAGHEQSKYLGNQIIRLYAAHGDLVEARKVFSKLRAPDEFVWASIISAYGEQGQAAEAMKLYKQMRECSARANDYIYVALLKACASAGDLASGKLVHADVMDSGFESNVFVGNTLVDMYAKCGRLDDARATFDRLPFKNVVTWNAMTAGYAQHGLGRQAFELYGKMQQAGITPNSVTFVSILKACSSLGALQDGRWIHEQIAERGLEENVFVGTALVNMYVKCGNLQEAHSVFDKMPSRNAVTWTAMVAGYAQHGLGHEAVKLYLQMQQEGMIPDNVTFVSTLKACGSIGAIQEGRRIHAQILDRELEADVITGNSLVDMYAKCGSLEDARKVFDGLSKKNVGTWNTLINGYGQHNQCTMAMQCFEEMLQQGIEPNAATFTCLLVACSHVGLVDEGREYFRLMTEKHGISPTAEHYNCMVDLLGRSGRLDEAESLLHAMPFDPGSVAWTSLLSACKTYNNADLGRRCFEQLALMNPQEASSYVLMSNIYADAGRWEDVEDIEGLRKCAGAKKKPAKATIEINNTIHEFAVGDMSFSKSGQAYTKLRSLNAQMKGEGFVPNLSSILKPMSDEQKEDALCGHAEKLALAFGLLNTPQGTSLLVTKDLRMCDNCHRGTKIISRIERREIIIRDSHRVHRFKDGSCSCGDSH